MKSFILSFLNAFLFPIFLYFIILIILAFTAQECSHSDIKMEAWTKIPNIIEFSTFYLNLFYIVVKLSNFEVNKKEYLTYFTMLMLNFVCGNASLLNYLSSIWGICSDIYK